jgi:hypothetical protein
MSRKSEVVKALDKPSVSTTKDIAVGPTNSNIDVIRQALIPFKTLISPERVEKMAREGLSQWTIASIFECQYTTIDNNPELMTAFNKGRADFAQRTRAKVIESAFENNVVPAQIYLDKIFSKEEDIKKVEVSVSTRPLENIPTEQLLEIDIDEDTDKQE